MPRPRRLIILMEPRVQHCRKNLSVQKKTFIILFNVFIILNEVDDTRHTLKKFVQQDVPMMYHILRFFGQCTRNTANLTVN
jgi:hypothetical protein